MFGDGKNTMYVFIMNQFRGHGCSTVNEIHVATSSEEMAVTAEREEFSLLLKKKKKIINLQLLRKTI